MLSFRPRGLAALLLIPAISLFFPVAPLSANAQESLIHASVTGRVIDPSGASVPHILVTATQPATNQRYSAETDAQGRFRLPFLAIGQYRIRAQAPGFAEVSQDVEVSVGSAFDVSLRLSLATAATSVQVSGF